MANPRMDLAGSGHSRLHDDLSTSCATHRTTVWNEVPLESCFQNAFMPPVASALHGTLHLQKNIFFQEAICKAHSQTTPPSGMHLYVCI
jgi:hypothetical protein